MFAEDCIRQFNDTPTMKKVILSAVAPRDFMGTTVYVYDKETKQREACQSAGRGDTPE